MYDNSCAAEFPPVSKLIAARFFDAGHQTAEADFFPLQMFQQRLDVGNLHRDFSLVSILIYHQKNRFLHMLTCGPERTPFLWLAVNLFALRPIPVPRFAIQSSSAKGKGRRRGETLSESSIRLHPARRATSSIPQPPVFWPSAGGNFRRYSRPRHRFQRAEQGWLGVELGAADLIT